ncbi:MAG: acetyl-CoA carboxylase biotin carboxyl carrier protein subunit [Bacteroidales bacterium]|nr:acetyl-CoA carboxylase biotin carboxyl carrier protein subunit [Bacteroidales bacterium]
MSEEIKLDHLVVQGAMYKTTLTPKFKHRKAWKAPNPNLIYSFIPGTVIDVLVKPGQKVKEGETLVLLEAMKMHNSIVMPFDGEVVKVNVQPKDSVSKKEPMIEIRPK